MPFGNPPVPSTPAVKPEDTYRVSSDEGAPLVQPGQEINSDKISKFHAKGITVDDDNNEPNKLNAADLGLPSIGTWGQPSACCHASQGHLKVCGRWAGMTRATITEMDELQLFML